MPYVGVVSSGAQEVFVRRSYLQHGLVAKEGAVVIDAGANIGLFSLQCLREAKGVQVGDGMLYTRQGGICGSGSEGGGKCQETTLGEVAPRGKKTKIKFNKSAKNKVRCVH